MKVRTNQSPQFKGPWLGHFHQLKSKCHICLHEKHICNCIFFYAKQTKFLACTPEWCSHKTCTFHQCHTWVWKFSPFFIMSLTCTICQGISIMLRAVRRKNPPRPRTGTTTPDTGKSPASIRRRFLSCRALACSSHFFLWYNTQVIRSSCTS